MTNRLMKICVVFLALVVLAIVLKALKSFLLPFVLAIIFCVLIMPINKESQRTKTVMKIGSSVILIVVLITAMSVAFVDSYDEISSSFTNINADSIDELIPTIQIGPVVINLKEYINSEEMSLMIGKIASSVFSGVWTILSELFAVLLFLIFLIPSFKSILKTIEKSLPESKQESFVKAVIHIEQNIKTYLTTKILISFSTALTTGAVLYFFGSKYILILMCITFFLNFIPNIGSVFAVALALIVYTISAGVTLKILWLGIIIFGVQMFFGNYLEPKITGERMKLSPIVILLSLFLWNWIWGVEGMLIAVPLVSIIVIVLHNIKSTQIIAHIMSRG